MIHVFKLILSSNLKSPEKIRRKMIEMAYKVSDFEESKTCKERSFGSNNSNEPISVLDKRRSPSPSPSTSTSTLSSATKTTTTTAALALPDPQKWPHSLPQTTLLSGSQPDFPTIAVTGRKNEWPEIHPTPPEFAFDDWESLDSPAHDQTLLRWISGDVDDTSLSLQQLLQGNQIDENTPPVAGNFQTPAPQNPLFPSDFNPQVALYPPPPPPPPPPPEIQFHHQGLQYAPNFDQCLRKVQAFTPNFDQGVRKVPAFTPDHEVLLRKQNQQLALHQQHSVLMVGAKHEPPAVAEQAASPAFNHQQLICDHLFAAAELMLSGNFPHAQAILARLNHQLPSPDSPFERAAFYFKEAMLTKTSYLASNLNLNFVPQIPFNGIYKMGAYKMLSEVSPVIQFMNFTSTQILLEAVGDAQNIHVIDFDIGFGAQWASFIQELPMKNNGGRCSLKITAFASPSTHHPIDLGIMHENMSQFAGETGVLFELEVVNFDSFDPRSFSVSGNEAIAVNFPIWSASTHLSAIPSILHFIKRLSPRIVVSLDRGCERMDLPFPHYVLQGLQYYELLLNSFDGANIPSDVSNKIEKFLFQPQIESMVLGKLQNPEPMPHWKTLFTAGGYRPVVLSNLAEVQADCLVKRTQVRGFHVEKKQASLVLCWQNRELVAASAWKC